jgi:hypothetical protein
VSALGRAEPTHDLFSIVLRGNGIGVVRHYLGEGGFQRVLAFGQNTANGISLGEDADQGSIGFGYQNGANVMAVHVTRRHHYCSSWR